MVTFNLWVKLKRVQEHDAVADSTTDITECKSQNRNSEQQDTLTNANH